MYFLPKTSTGIIFITSGSRPGEREREFYPMQREMSEAVLKYVHTRSISTPARTPQKF
jgi:hypothetical protein